jgi:hypothetical protein
METNTTRHHPGAEKSGAAMAVVAVVAVVVAVLGELGVRAHF